MTKEYEGDEFALRCPAPRRRRETIELAHGGGGRLMHDLIDNVFARNLRDPELDTDRDGALVDSSQIERLAFTTDSYVVDPLFFPGGNIGDLAVYGTVNDLAMCGAVPRYLSAAFILEEGFAIAALERIVESMRTAARRAQVHIATADTKVVERGKGDGVFINTSGIGAVSPTMTVGPTQVRPGDAIIVSGDLGRHGMAILGVRKGLEFESAIESDCAPLSGLVAALDAGGLEVHCMRDLTRGGLVSALVEIARAAELDIVIEDGDIPVSGPVRAGCELLGLDPLYMANEGRMVAFVAAADTRRALDILRVDPLAADAARIGVVGGRGGRVTLRTRLGTERILDMQSGEQLPRIC